MTGQIWGTWPRDLEGPSSPPLGVLIYKTSLTSSIFQSPGEQCKIEWIRCYSGNFSLIKLIFPI